MFRVEQDTIIECTKCKVKIGFGIRTN